MTTDRAAPALLPREPTEAEVQAMMRAVIDSSVMSDMRQRALYLLRAAPKIESAEAPGADVAELMRVISSFVCSNSHAENLLRRCRSTLESLSTQLADERKRIAEHNKRCERECDGICFRRNAGKGCITCPRRYMIEVPK
jgi:hypothetical protein